VNPGRFCCDTAMGCEEVWVKTESHFRLAADKMIITGKAKMRIIMKMTVIGYPP